MTQVAAVILAAGGSTRFGRCKQLLDWGGVSLLAHIADVALEAQLRPVIVVLGYGAKETYRVLGDRPVQKVMNWGWQAGKSTSLRIGLAAVPPESDAAVFLQCDQPLVTADLLQAVVNRFNGTGALIVHPTHAGRRGTPVLFSERLFAELSTVTGDQGGRVLIDRHPDQVATVDVDSMAVLTDVDTPEDYERLRSAAGFRTEADRENAASHLQPIRHLIIDMDGVLWTGDQPKAGLQQFFAFLDRQRIAFMLATNNSTSPPERYVAKLARYGVDVPAEMVLTSALASAAYMMDVARPGSKVYVIGEEGIREALEQHGFLLG
ncbi:MAG: NTP transferase domain-containing protein, partial [Anaerolineae bacterium]